MPKLSLAAVFLATAPLLAQQSGVSHPPEVDIEATPAATVSTAPVPVVNAPVLVVPTAAAAANSPSGARSTATGSLEESPAVTLKRHDLTKFDPDSRVVGDDTYTNPQEIAAGTLVRARLRTAIESATTQPGTPFRAEITEPVLHEGRVIVPAGALLEGRVTDVRSGRRIHGAALIHLQVQTIVLPDGSRMPLHASVVDTDRFGETRIDSEGNILRRDHPKQTLATMGLTAGGAAAAGGLIAGVPGALVGAGVGAGVSTVLWLKEDRQAQLPADTLVVLSLTEPLPIQSLVREPDYSRQSAAPAAAPVTAVPVSKEPQAFVPLD